MKKKEERIRIISTRRFSYRTVCGGDKMLIVTLMVDAILLINQLFSVGFNPLNIQIAYASGADVGKNHSVNNIDSISDIFVFGSGIFAGILFALSFNAYGNLKTKRLLLVSVAFAIFSVHAIVSKLDLFRVKLESSVLEIVLAILSFVALAIFFLAIVRREKTKTRTTTERSSSLF
jgi:hypothetical protein